MQAVFALIIFTIFVLAFVIQAGGIVLPQWAKTWQGVSPDLIPEYAGALLGSICVIAGLFTIAGVILIRSETTRFMTGYWTGYLRVTILEYGIKAYTCKPAHSAPWIMSTRVYHVVTPNTTTTTTTITTIGITHRQF
ncbi:hypothetical protein F4809DRAFT_637425 [Biscogniauxia mediterranea]|nr:hypothetical protein F4809DRAFT_637425 [Biscogniauxia mediterranea]